MATTPLFGSVSSGNNAPPPLPNSYNGVGYGGSSGFNFPLFGSNTVTTPESSLSPFSSSSSLSSLSSGFDSLGGGTQYSSNIYNLLGKAYGQGTGQMLGNILTQGLFNPTVANAMLAAMQPGINQGETNLMDQFGSEGARFGSAASIGLGNYLSQADLNENEVLAQMYENAQNEQIGVLENVLPTIHQERADEGGWLNDLVGGLETIGGGILDAASIAGAPFTGGTSLLGLAAGTSLMSGGISELNSGINASSGVSNTGGGTSSGSISPALLQMLMQQGGSTTSGSGNTGTFGTNAPTYSGGNTSIQQLYDQMMLDEAQSSGGTTQGGTSTNNIPLF